MRLASLLLLCLVPPVVSGQSPTFPPEMDGARVETYKTTPQSELKMWIFDPPNLKPGEQRPAIVFFFGGGWRAGTPSQFEHQCRYLASQGMVAMTADYRVLNRHKTLADKCVADAKSAIRWVRKNASRLGVDPNRIVAAGGSAGGHLAACTAVIDGLDEASDEKDVSSIPDAMALFNPALVLAPFDGTTLDDEKLASITKRTGVPPEAISPIHHIREGLPPTIIFHGEADTKVPFATAKRYAEVATAKGNHCELAAYPDATHGFFNRGRNGSPGEHYLVTLGRLHRFLTTLGYMEGTPEIVPESSNVHLRNHFANSWKAFAESGKGTVAFIGGSITEMKGYRLMVEQDLRKRFPKTEFTFINAGISSTCSTTGAHRLVRDVLSGKPDLLFIEFAVNDDQDAGHAERECRRGMEGILRQARENDPAMDVVVTHFVNPRMLDLLKKGTTPLSSGTHESVARHYGVSSIDLAREVAERINANRLTWNEFGGTHPAPPGNRIAADMIVDLLDAAWADARHVGNDQPAEHRIPKKLDSGSYSDGRLVSVTDAETDKSWVVGRPAWDSIPGGKRARFTSLEMLCTEAAGAELKLDFDGRAVGLFVLAGPDAGRVEYSIDDAPFESAELYHRHSAGLHYPRTVMLATDLKTGKHSLTLRVADESHPKSKGNAVRILNFVAN